MGDDHMDYEMLMTENSETESSNGMEAKCQKDNNVVSLINFSKRRCQT